MTRLSRMAHVMRFSRLASLAAFSAARAACVGLLLLGLLHGFRGAALAAEAPAADAPGDDSAIHILVDGVLMEGAVTPVIMQGRVLIPLRAVVEYLDGRVHWYADEQQIIGFRGAKGFDLIVGASRANLSDGSIYELDVPARIIAGRAYVPLRFVSEAMGCLVAWDAGARTAVITTVPMDAKKEVTELVWPTLLKVTTDKGTGSGFFYSKDGQAVTTADLVDGAAWILVVAVDGTEYPAEPIVVDRAYNLAKLRVKRSQGDAFPVFRYYDDFQGVAAEEKVYAFASPLLAEEPAVGGAVSGKAEASGSPGSTDIYRITAAIDQKYSGGPLVKENGALIGVNGFTEPGESSTAYAIPIEYVFSMKNR